MIVDRYPAISLRCCTVVSCSLRISVREIFRFHTGGSTRSVSRASRSSAAAGFCQICGRSNADTAIVGDSTAGRKDKNDDGKEIKTTLGKFRTTEDGSAQRKQAYWRCSEDRWW